MHHEKSHRRRDRDGLRFFLHWLRRPGRTGALVPSGAALTAALAAEIETETPGVVIELGPGTGRVTEALLAAGVAPNQLIAVERNASFCKPLRERFPGVQVLWGDARALKSLLQRTGARPVKAVVSSLPLLNMSSQDRRAVLSQVAAVLDDAGVLVQYTYGPAEPISAELAAELGLVGERANWVLANFPPAAVWRYRRRHMAPDMSRVA
jgi:phosphatidylethanolamine/phosphatidyl-N-methylethanolamine N-methyltransferase